jgi:predicted dehydrogenase
LLAAYDRIEVEDTPIYRTALIGLGNIAWRLGADNPSSQPPLTHMVAFHSHAQGQVVGGFSPDQNDRNDFARKYQIDTCDRLDLLLDKRPDIVSVCSPSQFHFEQVKACLEREAQ